MHADIHTDTAVIRVHAHLFFTAPANFILAQSCRGPTISKTHIQKHGTPTRSQSRDKLGKSKKGWIYAWKECRLVDGSTGKVTTIDDLKNVVCDHMAVFT